MVKILRSAQDDRLRFVVILSEANNLLPKDLCKNYSYIMLV